MRQTFRPAAVAPEYLIRFLAAGAFRGDLLQLVFELFFSELAAFETVARFDDFFDIQLEDIAPAKLVLGVLAPPQKNTEPPAAFLESELDFFSDLVVVRDRLLRLAGERHPNRRHVDKDHHRPGGQGASGLRHPVVAPSGIEHGFERRAGRLLIE